MPTYLVKYSPEIGTKSKATKAKFTRRLKDNIVAALKNHLTKTEFKAIQLNVTVNHFIIRTDVNIDELLKPVFGIQCFTKAIDFPFDGLATLMEKGLAYFKDFVIEAGTYAVRCKVTHNQQVSQRQIEKALGEQLQPFGRVNLDNPGVTCYVEIRGNHVYLYHEKIFAEGGAPIGVQGKAMTLFSGGMDSPVAAWLNYRTGLDQDFLFFDLGSDAQRQKAQAAFRTLKRDWGPGSKGRFIELSFLPLIEETLKVRQSFQSLVLKYFFYLAADQVAAWHKAKTLVTGESIGQVSTQTIQNLSALDQVSESLIIRPLSAFSKGMITDYAHRIGTLEASYQGAELCALSGKNVVTEATYAELRKVVKPLNTDLVKEVVENRLIYDLDQDGQMRQLSSYRDSQQINTKGESESFEKDITLTTADQVIDLRNNPKPVEELPPNTLAIDFQKAWQDYLHWDPGQSYFIVCEAGSRSKILAHHMQQEGFQVKHWEGGINGKT